MKKEGKHKNLFLLFPGCYEFIETLETYDLSIEVSLDLTEYQASIKLSNIPFLLFEEIKLAL